jgi:uncharacterized protein YjiS (DUF1127 family)
MITLKMVSEKIDAWFRYRKALRELSQLSDRELCDIGVRRSDIEDIVRRNAAAPARAGLRRRLPSREIRSPSRQPSQRFDHLRQSGSRPRVAAPRGDATRPEDQSWA